MNSWRNKRRGRDIFHVGLNLLLPGEPTYGRMLTLYQMWGFGYLTQFTVTFNSWPWTPSLTQVRDCVMSALWESRMAVQFQVRHLLPSAAQAARHVPSPQHFGLNPNTPSNTSRRGLLPSSHLSFLNDSFPWYECTSLHCISDWRSRRKSKILCSSLYECVIVHSCTD